MLRASRKKRELVLTATGQRTHLTLSAYILKPCFAAGLFLSRLSALPRPGIEYAGGGRGYSRCSPERVA